MKATQTFHLYDPEQAKYAVFHDGDDVPEHLADLVGKHVVDSKPEAASKEENPPPAGDGDSGGSDGGGDPAASGANQSSGSAELYDPSAHDAKDVAKYLAGLDPEKAEDVAEYERVVQAEKDGKNRSSALPA